MKCHSCEAFRREAGSAGDLEQVVICDRALDGDAEALAECLCVLEDAEAAATDGYQRRR